MTDAHKGMSMPCVCPLLSQIFEAKEKAIAEMGQLMTQAKKEQAGFEEEWRQLTQVCTVYLCVTW